MASGKLLPIGYNGLMFSLVTDLADFFKGSLTEMKTVRAIYNSIKLCFNVPGDKIRVEVVEGERIYKYTVISPDIYKIPLGWFVYLPLEKRLDFYSQDSPQLPLVQWKNKKAIWKGYADILDRANLDSIFKGIINVL